MPRVSLSFLAAVERGLERACAGLEELSGSRIYLESMGVDRLPVLEIGDRLSKEERVVAVFVTFEGEVTGCGLLVLSEEGARWMARRLLGAEMGEDDPLFLSVLQEVGNISLSGFLNGVADYFGVSIRPSAPVFIRDTLAAVTNSLVAAVSAAREEAYFVRTRFYFGDEPGVTGHLVLLPEAEFEAVDRTGVPAG